MRIASLTGALSLSVVVSIVACAAPDYDGSSLGKGNGSGKGKGTSSSTSSTGGEGGDETDRLPDNPSPNPKDDPPPASSTSSSSGSTTPPPDGDSDGIPDATDCDPISATIAGTKLLDDDLATEKGFFTTADGFPQTSWTHDGVAYRQTRLLDAADVTMFNKDPSIGDVIVEVRASSTEISGAITPRLRQMFIVMGTQMTGGQLSAVGCGVEVAQGETVEQKTSIVRFQGPPGAVGTQVVQRVDRPALQAGEEFGIKATLSKGTLTCEVQQAAKTTATSIVGGLTGSVGFFTRQTKALFKKAKICKLK